jgi:hypothetical protein
MIRNWDAEWQELSNAQDRAFQELRKAMTIVTGTFLGQRGPSVEQMERAETAKIAWEDSKRRIKAWLDEWRTAHRDNA